MSFDWVCPRCKGVLDTRAGAYQCQGCNSQYRDFVGIPDFRLGYQELDSHVALAQRFHREWDRLTYEQMVRLRWSGLRERHLQRGGAPCVLKAWDADEEACLASYRTRGASHVLVLRALVQKVRGIIPVRHLVDVGSGWGRDLIHLATIAEAVLGVDVCSFSLLMAKKLLEEQKVTNVQLALAQGEFLPLRQSIVDAMNCSATIEHFPDPGMFLREASRCLRPNGWLFLYYPNRFSLLPETHTGIFGLGWLPAEWQKKVVAKKRGGSWNTILFSRSGFMRMVGSQFAAREVWISGIPEGLESFMCTSKFSTMLGPCANLLRACFSIARRIPGCERTMSICNRSRSGG